LVLGSIEDEIDEDEMVATFVAEPPADCHSMDRMNISFLKMRDQLSENLGGKDALAASKLMVRSEPVPCVGVRLMTFVESQGTPTMDAEQLTHVEHFFYAQVNRATALCIITIIWDNVLLHLGCIVVGSSLGSPRRQ